MSKSSPKFLICLIGFVFVLVGATSYAWLPRRANSRQENANISVVPVGASQYVTNLTKKIRRIARERNTAVSKIESDIADLIMARREAAFAAAGGRAYGVHIVDDNREKLSSTEVTEVSIGEVVDFAKAVSDKKYQKIPPEDGFPESNFYVDPLPVKGTDLAGASVHRNIPAGVYLKGPDYATTDKLRAVEQTPSGRSGWTGLTQVFTNHASLGTVLLEQSDNVAAGTTVIVPKSSINGNVGDYPSTLIRMRDSSGATMSSISWIGKGGATFSLKINQIDDPSVKALQAIAEQLASAGK